MGYYMDIWNNRKMYKIIIQQTIFMKMKITCYV